MDKQNVYISEGDISKITTNARKELSTLTGLEPSNVVGVNKDGEEWVVTLEMIEKKSIPDSMDILGAYEVRLNTEGELVNFIRLSLRKRGDITYSLIDIPVNSY